MKEYKITPITQFQNGWQILGFGIASIVAVLIVNQFQPDIDTNPIFLSLVLFLPQFIPWLPIHLKYFLTNRNDILKYNKTTHDFVFIHGNQIQEFNLSEIKMIIVYKSIPLYKGGIQLLSWDHYNHTVIVLKNDIKITLTSLMFGGNIKLPVSKWKTKVRLNLYRWPIGPSLQYP